jgi:hypothetical protein
MWLRSLRFFDVSFIILCFLRRMRRSGTYRVHEVSKSLQQQCVGGARWKDLEFAGKAQIFIIIWYCWLEDRQVFMNHNRNVV